MKKKPTGLLGRTQSTARRLSRKRKELVKSLSTKSAKIASYKAPPPDDSTQVSQQAQSAQPGGVLQKCKNGTKKAVGAVLTNGKYFVFRKFASTCFEASSQATLVVTLGDTGVPAPIMAALMVVIFLSLNLAPWYLTSQTAETRQIVAVIAELFIDVLYVGVSFAAFWLYVLKFQYEGIDCYALTAGFGSFELGCYDVGDRQQTVYAFKALVSNSYLSLWANMTPMVGLAAGLDHLATLLATQYGEHIVPVATIDRQLPLPKAMTIITSLISVLGLTYGLVALTVNEKNCAGISACSEVAHPLFDFWEGCACAAFITTTCGSSTEDEIILSAEKGYLRTLVVGKSTALLSYAACSNITNMDWDVLPQVEFLVLSGTQIKAPVDLLPLGKLLAFVARGGNWTSLPLMPPSLVYLRVNCDARIDRFDAGDWTALADLRVFDLQRCGMKMMPDISECLALENINVVDNQLATLPDLSQHVNLKQLYFSRNSIEIMPKLPTSLTVLRAGANKLTDVHTIEHLRNLEECVLTDNLLTSKPFPNGVPSGLLLVMAGNPICETCGPVDCGICEYQCNVGCSLELLMANRVCDDACNAPSCGYDQEICGDSSQLPCTDWCLSSGRSIFQLLDANSDGIISGVLEMDNLQQFYFNPLMEIEGTFLSQGMIAFMMSEAGVAPSGTSCWGCDVAGMR